MNREHFAGNWNAVRGKVKERWGKLSDDDLQAIGGRFDHLVGMIQKRYGKERDAAEKEVDHWLETIEAGATNP
jgi:uncharacterized protein YjbJ (UPF0337 family)